jgi:glyoxylase-like metal-dependent hydrolase (beta-lactamase superfamily II)
MNPAHRLAAGVSWIDLRFLGRPKRIAAVLLQGAAGAAIVDPGPTSCLPTLEDTLERAGTPLSAVSHLLLTHIHLDHAGAAGTIARRYPAMRVVVHRHGARHLADPAKLIESATRLYGADMDRMWGACEPVPERQLQVVDGGEVLDVAGRRVSVTYTPGHAKHHVTYFDPTSRIAWVGDVAGVCIPDDRSLMGTRMEARARPLEARRASSGNYVLPPTPPPDIDLPGWRQSIERIEAMQADTLFLTHYGPVMAPGVHLRALADNLEMMAGLARESLAMPGTDEEQKAAFDDRLRRELRRHMDEEQARSYESAAAFGLSWAGLARYLRRMEGRS